MRARTFRSVVVLAVVVAAGCGGGDDEPAVEVEETTTTAEPAEETTTTAEDEEETTTTVVIDDEDDDANGDGVLDPFCSEADFGGGLMLQVQCDLEGLTSEVPEGVTLVPGSLFGLRSSIHRDLTGISGNLIVSRAPDGSRVFVLVFQSDALFASGSTELSAPSTFDGVVALVAPTSREAPSRCEVTPTASATRARTRRSRRLVPPPCSPTSWPRASTPPR